MSAVVVKTETENATRLQIKHRILNCIANVDLGLGTCHCVTHPIYIEEVSEISELLERLKRGYKDVTISVQDGIEIRVLLNTRPNLYGEEIESEAIIISIT